jgi:hypothetical protein
MNIFDRLFAGKVIQDFGTLDERSLGIGKIKHSALLVERYGRLYFVIKTSTWVLFSGGFSYDRFALDDALKIREYIGESEQISQNLPALPYDVSKVALRNSIIIMAVASVVNLLLPDAGLVFMATAIAVVFFHGNQFIEFTNHPDVNSRTKKWLFIIPIMTLLVAVSKFCWLTWPLLQALGKAAAP